VWSGGAEVANLFTTRVQVNGHDKWTENWIFSDLNALRNAHTGSNKKYDLRYVSPDTNAAGYILAYKAQIGGPLWEMSIDFFYESFDLNLLPAAPPPGNMRQVSYDVYTTNVAGIAPGAAIPVANRQLSGKLFRVYRSVVGLPGGKPEVTHIDHWVLFGNYVLPDNPNVGTLLIENGGSPPSARVFGQNAEAAAIAAGQIPQWIVRTSAIYEQI